MVDQPQGASDIHSQLREPLQHSRSLPLSGWSRPSIRPMNLYEGLPTLSVSLVLSYDFPTSSFTSLFFLHFLSTLHLVDPEGSNRLLEFLLRSNSDACLSACQEKWTDRVGRCLGFMEFARIVVDRRCYGCVMLRNLLIVKFEINQTITIY